MDNKRTARGRQVAVTVRQPAAAPEPPLAVAQFLVEEAEGVPVYALDETTAMAVD